MPISDLLLDMEQYTDAYITSFNSISREFRESLNEVILGESILIATIIPASDGVVIFYYPESLAIRTREEPGIYVRPKQDKTLATVLQEASYNCVKVIEASTTSIGSDINPTKRLPPDLPEEQVSILGLSPEMVSAMAKGIISRKTILGVAPIRRHDQGIALFDQPTRLHLFSPILEIFPGQFIRQQAWAFCDIIWKPEHLLLDKSLGDGLATKDLEVLHLGIQAGLPQNELVENSYESVANALEKTCMQFEILLNLPGTLESDIQRFLERPGSHFLISPQHLAIYPQKPIGGFKKIPDFVVQRSDGDYHFVELESPNKEIFQQSAQGQTAHLTHAIEQVEDWLRLVEDHRDFIQMEDGLIGIYKPSGEVVAGRDRHLGPEAKRRFNYKRGESHRITIKTYDMMLAEGRAYVKVLRDLQGPKITRDR